MPTIDRLTEEERKYLLLIEANGAIAFEPSQDAELARLLELGLLQREPNDDECILVRLTPLGREIVAGLSL